MADAHEPARAESAADAGLWGLIALYADGALSTERAALLEQRLKDDPAALEQFVLYMEIHARVAWQSRAADEAAVAMTHPAEQPVAASRGEREPRPQSSRLFAWWDAIARGLEVREHPWRFLSAAAAVTAMLWLVFGAAVLPWNGGEPPVAESDDKGGPGEAPELVARLVRNIDAQFAPGAEPVAANAWLLRGQRVELEDGFVEIAFHDGARVILHGPAVLRLESAAAARLEVGQLVARVEKPAAGFVIFTPQSVVRDLGTEFGVDVDAAGVTEVEVFEGEVALESLDGERQALLQSGDQYRIALDGTVTKLAGAPTRFVRSLDHSGLGDSTTLAAVADAYVHAESSRVNFGADPTLQLKHSDRAPKFRRAAWVRFDLSSLRADDLLYARLVMHAAPTGIGGQGGGPREWRFRVLALSDANDWSETSIAWEQFDKCDLRNATPLGNFVLFGPGLPGQKVHVGGRRLAEFLRAHAGEQIDLAIVRATPGAGAENLVHGLASREHGDLPGPQLQLWYSGRAAEGDAASDSAENNP
jgi:hypothetical protein